MNGYGKGGTNIFKRGTKSKQAKEMVAGRHEKGNKEAMQIEIRNKMKWGLLITDKEIETLRNCEWICGLKFHIQTIEPWGPQSIKKRSFNISKNINVKTRRGGKSNFCFRKLKKKSIRGTRQVVYLLTV